MEIFITLSTKVFIFLKHTGTCFVYILIQLMCFSLKQLYCIREVCRVCVCKSDISKSDIEKICINYLNNISTEPHVNLVVLILGTACVTGIMAVFCISIAVYGEFTSCTNLKVTYSVEDQVTHPLV